MMSYNVVTDCACGVRVSVGVPVKHNSSARNEAPGTNTRTKGKPLILRTLTSHEKSQEKVSYQWISHYIAFGQFTTVSVGKPCPSGHVDTELTVTSTIMYMRYRTRS